MLRGQGKNPEQFALFARFAVFALKIPYLRKPHMRSTKHPARWNCAGHLAPLSTHPHNPAEVRRGNDIKEPYIFLV
jgi:hypothetical protein